MWPCLKNILEPIENVPSSPFNISSLLAYDLRMVTVTFVCEDIPRMLPSGSLRMHFLKRLPAAP